MSKEALADAYAAGFKDGRSSAATVQDDDAATHCVLGFDGWWRQSNETMNRAPTETDDGWIKWDGSTRYPPVMIGDSVQVRFESGKVSQRAVPASDWGWQWHDSKPGIFDIVAYKVVK